MVMRFSVEAMFDWTGRGLLISGFTLGGVIEPGMVLADGTGARARVVAIEPESPRDRREGWTTLLVEPATPSPVERGMVLVVAESPAVAYTYHESPGTVTVAEATPGTRRAMTIELATSRRHWVESPPPGSREITRADAERLVEAAGTILPSGPELRRILLRRA
jgi:hypothetical protein